MAGERSKRFAARKRIEAQADKDWMELLKLLRRAKNVSAVIRRYPNGRFVSRQFHVVTRPPDNS